MKRIAAAAFKAKCLRLLDEVARTRDELIITKRGKAVARLLPVNGDGKPNDLRGSVLAEKDVLQPLDEAWEADR